MLGGGIRIRMGRARKMGMGWSMCKGSIGIKGSFLTVRKMGQEP